MSAERRGARHPITLRQRLVGTLAILSALGLFLAGLAALLVERRAILARIDAALAQEMAEFTELARTGQDPETGEQFGSAERLITVAIQHNVPNEHETLVGYISDATIVPVDGGGQLHRDGDFRELATAYTAPGFGDHRPAEGERVRFAVTPITRDGVRSHYVTAYFVERELDELRETIRTYAFVAVGAWVTLVLGAWLLARRILGPIHELRDTAATITHRHLDGRIVVTGQDEVADLGRTFNDMLDRLQDALGAQRRMLDDAGHELRTPITVIRGHLELMDATDPGDVEATRELALDELDRMGGLVQDLIFLAKARRPDFLSRASTQLDDVIVDAFEKSRVLADRDWRLAPVTPLRASADPQRLTQALLQLASNAVAVTAAGDAITIGLREAGNDRAHLWVRDTGPGVPPHDHGRIFNRAVTGSATTGGTGLGLAIVLAIAQAHGGTAYVEDAVPGSGACFVIEIPCEPNGEG